jgi:hypothetical protein
MSVEIPEIQIPVFAAAITGFTNLGIIDQCVRFKFGWQLWLHPRPLLRATGDYRQCGNEKYHR